MLFKNICILKTEHAFSQWSQISDFHVKRLHIKFYIYLVKQHVCYFIVRCFIKPWFITFHNSVTSGSKFWYFIYWCHYKMYWHMIVITLTLGYICICNIIHAANLCEMFVTDLLMKASSGLHLVNMFYWLFSAEGVCWFLVCGFISCRRKLFISENTRELLALPVFLDDSEHVFQMEVR